MRAGRLNKWVTLSRCPQQTDDSDGYYEALSPPGEWVSIEPLTATGEGRSVISAVTMRYREDVTMDTRITFGSRFLYVRGFQNVNEHNTELRCLCEEVIP